MSRSSLAETRNPVLALTASKRFQDLPPEAREALADILKEISIDARARADQSWAKHKGPMAAYWKAVAVYCRHIRLAIRWKAA